MRSDDAEAGKFMVQTLNFVRPRGLQVEHQGFGALPGNCGADLFVTLCQINRIKVLRKTDRQNFCRSGVVLIENYALRFHGVPL